MSVTDQDLMAFADGELSDVDAARVASAVAADPALAARVDAERRLRTMLGGHFAPVAAEPVPETLTLMIAAAAAEETERDMTDAPVLEAPPPPARVLDFAAARAKRQAAAPAARKPHARAWGTGAAIAASLVLGLVLGGQFAGRGAIAERNGALVASGALAEGLDTQLASAVDDGAKAGGDLRVLASFQRTGGGYCRVFDRGTTAGIACKDRGQWLLERTASGSGPERGDYRQAGSAQADLMAAAQNMAVGEPLDAAQERAARVKRWGD
jgi:hypothetical protein